MEPTKEQMIDAMQYAAKVFEWIQPRSLGCSIAICRLKYLSGLPLTDEDWETLGQHCENLYEFPLRGEIDYRKCSECDNKLLAEEGATCVDCSPKCLNCGCTLLGIDGPFPTCARCRAEESHDYDSDPHARFDRGGRLMF